MQNASEKYVSELSSRAFLSLWSYPNPLKSEGDSKELCDLLVVCDPDIIIISVKHCQYKDTGQYKTDSERWLRKAIDDSVKQIRGAERQLKKLTRVVAQDGLSAIRLPSRGRRRVHRVAIAFGGGDKAPLKFGEIQGVFVHVFDDVNFEIFLSELDTISDMVQYLIDKEKFLTQRKRGLMLNGGEEDLLAIYLANEHSFPDKQSMIIVDEGVWNTFQSNQQYKDKKQADIDSYLWDEMIKSVIRNQLSNRSPNAISIDDLELSLRMMSKEDRLARRSLSKAFLEFANDREILSRCYQSEAGTQIPYVFLKKPASKSWEEYRSELYVRCFIVRGEYSDSATVIGILFEDVPLAQGLSFDLLRFHHEEWTDEMEAKRQEIILMSGFFKKPRVQKAVEDEYPGDTVP